MADVHLNGVPFLVHTVCIVLGGIASTWRSRRPGKMLGSGVPSGATLALSVRSDPDPQEAPASDTERPPCGCPARDPDTCGESRGIPRCLCMCHDAGPPGDALEDTLDMRREDLPSDAAGGAR